MNIKPPLLSIAAIIHIIYNLYFYLSHGRKNDEEGWGELATMILIGAGIVAIVIDVILYKLVKQKTVYLISGIVLTIIGYVIFYRM